MPRKKRISLNVDKLRQCYKQPEGLFEDMAQHCTGDYVQMNDYALHIIDDGRGQRGTETPTKVIVNVLTSDNILLGTFTFNKTAKYNGLCFFRYENNVLYQCMEYTPDKPPRKYNAISYLPYVADDLGLTLNNITELELAVDINKNPVPIIRKLIKYDEDFDMIINGKRVPDNKRELDNYGEYFTRSRAKLSRTPSLYFSQEYTDLKLRIYDKSKEIRDKGSKEYITEWDDFGKQSIYRMEVRMCNDDVNKWQKHIAENGCYLQEWQGTDKIIYLLGLDEYKRTLWEYSANRLVYWRDKATGKKITLYDIAQAC